MNQRTLVLTCAALLWGHLGLARSVGAQDRTELLGGFPDTILVNGKIVTVDNASFDRNIGTIAEAVAIRDGKVLAVGRTDVVRSIAGPGTRVIDLKGKTVVPGLISVHNHPHDWMRYVEEIQRKIVPTDVVVSRYLSGSTKQQVEGMIPALRDALKEAKPGVWVRIVARWGLDVPGEDFYAWNWPGKFVTKQQLDQEAPNNPVIVYARPGILRQNHIAMLNQKAVEVLRQEGPPDHLADLKNLDREERTGIRTSTMTYRMAEHEVIYKGRSGVLTAALKADLSWWAGLGMTTVGGALYHHPQIRQAYGRMDQEGTLPIRVAWYWGHLPNAAWERLSKDRFLIADLVGREGSGTDRMWYIGTGDSGGPCMSMQPLPTAAKPGVVKSEDGRSEELIMPPAGETCEGEYKRGGVLWNALYQVVKAGGRLIGSHQFGDLDVDNKLDLIEEASKEAGFTLEQIRAKRHAIGDHMSGWPRPDQIQRIARLGGIVGGTSFYIYQDPARWLRDYGEKALDFVVPRGGLVAAGVMNGIEVDKPLELTGENLFREVYWSIKRQSEDGKVYSPQQRLSREQALKSATIWGAHYVLREKAIGSLERGKWADLLVLDRDYLTVPEDDIPKIRVLMTLVGGEVAHLVPSLATELGMKPVGAQVELGGPAASW